MPFVPGARHARSPHRGAAHGLVAAVARVSEVWLQANGKSRTLKWTSSPVRQLCVTDAGVDGVTSNAVQAAVSKAFDTWTAVPTASVSFQFAGYTRNLPGEDDGRTTLGFPTNPRSIVCWPRPAI